VVVALIGRALAWVLNVIANPRFHAASARTCGGSRL